MLYCFGSNVVYIGQIFAGPSAQGRVGILCLMLLCWCHNYQSSLLYKAHLAAEI